MELTTEQQDVIDAVNKYKFIQVNAFAGTGKEQPYSEPILTPSGWRTMEELQVGDNVISADGSFTCVTGTYEQGEKEVYRITFSDGSFTRCGLDHLWKIYNSLKACTEVINLRTIINNYNILNLYHIELNEPIKTFYLDLYSNNQHSEDLMPASLMMDSLLLADDDIVTTELHISKRILFGDYRYRYKMFKEILKLKGNKFEIINKTLADDIVELVRSLGFYIKLTQEDGSYLLSINKTRKTKHIVDVQYLYQEKSKCIKVAHPSSLYITRDYTVTHNTTTVHETTKHYQDLNFLYLVFNAELAKEARAKFPSNTKIFTTHGLAYNYTKNELKLYENPPKVLPRPKTLGDKYGISDYDILYMGTKLFQAFCKSEYTDINNKIIKLLIRENADLAYRYKKSKTRLTTLVNVVAQIWNDIYNKDLPMTHDFYAKYFHMALQKYIPFMEYDVVLLDEAQDTNVMTMNIFDQLPGKKVIVGDAYQAIYGFNGAINAMNKFKNIEKKLYISHTFRFNDTITKSANFILNTLLNEKEQIIAEFPDKNAPIKDLCYITRTNSGIIQLFEQFVNEGKVPKTLRQPKEIFKLPLSILYFISDKWGNKNKITEKWLFSFSGRDELKKYGEDIGDIELLTSIAIAENYWFKLVDIYDQAVANRRKKKIDMVLTTAHTSKGKEWDKVVIHNDFPDLVERISEIAKNLEQFHNLIETHGDSQGSVVRKVLEEINLYYVSITRGIYEVKQSEPNAKYDLLSYEEIDNIIKECRKN